MLRNQRKREIQKMLIQNMNSIVSENSIAGSELPTSFLPRNFVFSRDFEKVCAGEVLISYYYRCISAGRPLTGNFGNTEGMRRAVACDEEVVRLISGRRQHHRSWKHRSCASRQWGCHGDRVRD